jgi:inner membrane protein
MKELFQNVFFKMFVIFILILILIIPAIMVQDLITERMLRQEEAVTEVSSKHAMEQQLTGPILTIPFRKTKTALNQQTGRQETVTERHYLHVLPDVLKIGGKVNPEKRKRGMYEVIVYNSDLNFKAQFDGLHLDHLNVSEDQIELDKAFMSIGITDLKGLSEQVKIHLNDSSYMCNPGIPVNDVLESGLHINVPLKKEDNKLKVDFSLELKGSQQLMFVPIGKETKVDLNSPWKDPSFDGEFLPHTRTVSNNGFTASWKVLHLNRNYPQYWVGERSSLEYSAFGVDLKLPVDVYQKSMRVAKYAMLFIVLTYLVFFFVEILNKVMIHPIQYILVGLALVLFYVLMLAFSEHIYFDWAYLLAAIMTIGLIYFYARAILQSNKLGGMTAAILTILYSFIFVIIQMQDWALLVGSIGVFLILAVTMHFSRKIDWFDLKKGKEQ